MLTMSSNSDSDTPVTPKKAKISKVLQKYKPEWEKKFNWITSDFQNKSNAKCITCGVSFTISSAGIGQVCFVNVYVHILLKLRFFSFDLSYGIVILFTFFNLPNLINN